MFDKENFKLSILIPCYNEVSSIDLIINKVLIIAEAVVNHNGG